VEQVYPVPPLRTPHLSHMLNPKSLCKYEAVQLFIERAQVRKSTFNLTDQNAKFVVHICHQLDGIPLAIELAAAPGSCNVS